MTKTHTTNTNTDKHTDAQIEGTVLEIIRMSTEDGPGLRTTVFFKGCPLSCEWCHNPESISPKPQIQWMHNRCLGCGICVDTCPKKALKKTPKAIKINRDICDGCGLCTVECPTTAMELLGKKWKVGDLADELVKDRVYFEQSGGGVTLSGGEAAMQHDFCLALLKELKKRGIQTALDTCGQIPLKTLTEFLPHVDILLFDIKEIHTEKHRRFTGTANERILDNAVFAAEYIKNSIPRKIFWIRTPIIPGATDTPENIRGIGAFISENMHRAVNRWELCSFNNLCRDKYKRLEMEWPYAETQLQDKARMEELCQIAKEAAPLLAASGNVCWSGATKLEEDAEGKTAPKQSPKVCGC